MLNYIRGISQVLGRDMCPYIMPWYKISDSTIDVHHVHQLSLKLWRQQERQRGHKPDLGMVLVTIFWPLISALRALKNTCKLGGYAARECGVSRWRQYWQQMYFVNCYNLSSHWYYYLLLFDRVNADIAADYFTDRELGSLQ
jgi:hypothetical protein